MEIKMAVATKPKEMAFMDVPKFFHGPSLSTPACDGLGSEAVYMSHGFGLSPFNSFIVLLTKMFPFSKFCCFGFVLQRSKGKLKNQWLQMTFSVIETKLDEAAAVKFSSKKSLLI